MNEQAKEYFRKAAEAGDSHGHYNMGILYLKGLGVKKDLKVACKHFMTAANKGHPKAFYQLAKMQQRGIPGLKRDPATVKRIIFSSIMSVGLIDILFQIIKLYVVSCHEIKPID